MPMIFTFWLTPRQAEIERASDFLAPREKISGIPEEGFQIRRRKYTFN
jgi:hypothetical protein